ncbi:putative cupin 2 conserved barrel domain protein [Botrytis cinerea BcDW1]|uniref:Putative cupin 2 conserved barrel domain protein n=1 Tax=Botryotinia fuckeliana (strain BcDW1) TaxID=1290391 RepID=M7TN51_BOTF1|nr:putative cupin 2 conserved barrel domain protein [Botrytis cinerea BcDW1]
MIPPAPIAPQPNVPVHYVKAETGEVITLGNVKLRVLEDGSRTVISFWVPANPSTGESEKRIDAGVGDYVVVPTRAPHTFSNETDEEAKFVNTFTPAFYIHYFKLLAKMMEEGKELTPEINLAAMAYYATIPVPRRN